MNKLCTIVFIIGVNILHAWLFSNPLKAVPQSKLRKWSNGTPYCKLLSSIIISINLMHGNPANAFGPVEVPLSNLKYKQVELCDGKKPIMPGQKAAQGLFPVCIEVDADAVNPTKGTLKDVSVYGFIKDNDAGNSVLPNNPDFRSDAGQYAMIKSLAPGESHVTFQFVAAVVTDPKREPIPGLTFFNTKAVSFPGGDRFKLLDECEIDPSSTGCAVPEEDE